MTSESAKSPRHDARAASTEAICATCESLALNPRTGRYNMRCLRCCARLIDSARPDRHQAHCLMASVERAIGRDRLREALKMIGPT